MTDAKQRLRALDRIETPDVWDRARTLEPTPELDGSVEHTRRKRVVVTVVAFAVFGAAAAFAWRGFRPSTTTTAGAPDVISSTVLWPERSESALLAAQASADAGDPGVAWRLDPTQVAIRFAEEVLGWGSPDGNYKVTITAGSETGTAIASLPRFALPCPPPLPGTDTNPTCPPPFEGETVTLQQEATAGPTGVWSITEVRADGLDVDLQPGQQILGETTITGDVTFPDTASSVPGFSAIAGIRVGEDPGCFIEQGGSVQEGRGTLITLSSMSAGGQDCGPTPGGYVWLTTSAPAKGQTFFPLTSPLDPPEGSSRPMFYGLTLVPVQVSFPGNSSPGEQTPSPSTQESISQMRLPIALDYPQGWSTQLVSSPEGTSPTKTFGLVIANSPQAMPSPGAVPPSLGALTPGLNLPSDYVSVTIQGTEDGASSSPGPDTPLPLSLGAAYPSPPGSGNFQIEGGSISARVAGSDLTITVSSGPDASQADIQAAAQIVASIRPSGASAP